MTTTIEERTAAREAALAAAVAASRRLARPEDYVFDKAQEAFWDLRDGTSKQAVGGADGRRPFRDLEEKHQH